MAPKSDPLPKNWPSGITYLTASTHCKTLTSKHTAGLQLRPDDTQAIPSDTRPGPCALVKITSITLPSHPAAGQSGLFASKDLKPGTFILQYLGDIHSSLNSQAESNTNSTVDPHSASDYDLSLDRELRIGVDAQKKGNEARFINDYRGVAQKPNAEFKEVWDDKEKERGMGVWVLPEGKSGKGKGIKKGEEILVSYGRGFWATRKEGGEQN